MRFSFLLAAAEQIIGENLTNKYTFGTRWQIYSQTSQVFKTWEV